MDRTLNNTLYEQVIYAMVLQLFNNKRLSYEEKNNKIGNIGQMLGKRLLFSLSSQLPYNSYSSLKRLLNLISNEFWGYVFDHQTSDITSPNPNSISFKDNNFTLLKRISTGKNRSEQMKQFIDLVKELISNMIKGVLNHFGHDADIKLIYQNDSLFININCFES